MRVRFIIDQLEIAVLKLEDPFLRRIELHLRRREGFAGQLQLCLFEVIEVQVRIAERMNKFAGLQLADLCHHQRQQRIRGEIERHAEKDIG